MLRIYAEALDRLRVRLNMYLVRYFFYGPWCIMLLVVTNNETYEKLPLFRYGAVPSTIIHAGRYCVVTCAEYHVNPLVPNLFHDFPSKYAFLKRDHGHEWVKRRFHCRSTHHRILTVLRMLSQGRISDCIS